MDDGEGRYDITQQKPANEETDALVATRTVCTAVCRTGFGGGRRAIGSTLRPFFSFFCVESVSQAVPTQAKDIHPHKIVLLIVGHPSTVCGRLRTLALSDHLRGEQVELRSKHRRPLSCTDNQCRVSQQLGDKREKQEHTKYPEALLHCFCGCLQPCFR